MGNDRLHLTVAINYGGRDEILRATRRVAEAVRAGRLSAEEITPETIEAHLDTAGLPDPDLILRTSGEFRVSGFLPWQSAYSEFAFVDTRWPDFTAEMFAAAGARLRRAASGGSAPWRDDRRRRPGRSASPTSGCALASGLVLAAIALLDLWAGGAWAAGFLALVLVLMLWEYHRMVTGDGRRRRARASSVAGGRRASLAIVATAIWGTPIGLATLAAGAVAVAIAGRPWSGVAGGGLRLHGRSRWARCSCCAPASPRGCWLILWLVLVVVAADVGAYFVGRSVGGRKLWPAVSPGKTWSGAVGGLGFAGPRPACSSASRSAGTRCGSGS